MLLANIIMKPKYKLTCLLLAALPMFCIAQENSPYSRYGVGNLVPAGNILNRGMGGISAGVADPATINTVNPASYANLVYSTLDVGVEYDGRIIKSQNPLGSYKSNNGIISYLQVGFPLLAGNKKAEAHKTSWGLSFGLKPISKINYKINAIARTSIDSVASIYEGSGGINEAYIGSALKIKNFSIGFNTGYLFGEKNYDTKLVFIDSIDYYKAEYNTKTLYGGVFLNAGFQYAINLKKETLLRIGGYGNLKQNFGGKKDYTVNTFTYDASTGSPTKIDSVYKTTGQKGNVIIPATFGGGFTFEKTHLLVGADFETTKWNDYRFFDQKDLVSDSWIAKIGLQYYPASTGTKSYFSYVKYRAGISFGRDYISPDNNLPFYTISAGAGFPMKLKRSFYETQYSVMNVGIEYGNRGNNSNNIKENIVRLSLGFALGDVWFLRRKFN
ncbi:MAG: hypothetical protein ABIN25_05105 [Ginsengibacter sp.]